MTKQVKNLYALTCTLKPKLYTHSPEEQYDLSKPIISNLFRIGKMTAIAEFTQNFNIHWHLLIERDTSIQCIGDKGRPISFERYVYDIFRKSDTIGFIKLKNISDKQGWIDYMSKDIEETKKSLARRVVIVDDFCLFKVFD